MTKAVIFDMDGVIIDSEPIQSLSAKKLIIEYGRKPILNKQGLMQAVGPSGDKSYEELVIKYNLKVDIETLRKRRREIFEDLLKEKLMPMPGFLELINALKKEKIKTAVASNRFIGHVHMIINNLKVKNMFETIIGPGPGIKHKPAPDIYLKTAEELGVDTKECLVLEDSETGIEAAKQAGMKVIAIPNKYTAHQDFSKSDKIVKSLKDISISLIKSI